MGTGILFWPSSPHSEEVGKSLELGSKSILIDDYYKDPFDRAKALQKWLLDPKVEFIWSGRGGYGATDLLDKMDWQLLEKKAASKLMLGFSDVTALQSALYTKLFWKSLHAPMPFTEYWNKDSTDCIESIACAFERILPNDRRLELRSKPLDSLIKGNLFGGCLSVLASLIGTPYIPRTLKNHILFFEDVNENFGQIQRHLFQFRESGLLKGVEAVILGCFDYQKTLTQDQIQLISKDLDCPVFSETNFGHTAPHHPLLIGGEVIIKDSILRYL